MKSIHAILRVVRPSLLTLLVPAAAVLLGVVAFQGVACNNVGSCPAGNADPVTPGGKCSGTNLQCPYTLQSPSPACDGTPWEGGIATSCICQDDPDGGSSSVWICPDPVSCPDDSGTPGDDGASTDDGGDGGGDDGGGDGATTDDGGDGGDGGAVTDASDAG